MKVVQNEQQLQSQATRLVGKEHYHGCFCLSLLPVHAPGQGTSGCLKLEHMLDLGCKGRSFKLRGRLSQPARLIGGELLKHKERKVKK